MTTIDQRILIPASPDVVWAYISSIERNREWRVDHQDLAFITTFRKGQGTRWRYTNGSRQEYVAEITAWYERMGYEYHIVDGGPFKTNRGRIRLQEIAEGTIIQWTFNYEIGGLLGGMRDAIGVRRNMENIIVDSLWALWRNIGQDEKARAESYTPKMLMREAPDVQSRANYTPRHPSVFRHGGPAPTPTAAPESSVLQQQMQQSEPPPAPSEPAPPVPAASSPIVEPPVSDEDTRPRQSIATSQEPPPVTQPPPADEPAAEREPDFLRDLAPAGDPQQPPSETDDVFKPPQPVEAPPEPERGVATSGPAPTVETSEPKPEPETPAASLEAETPPRDELAASATEVSTPEQEPTAPVVSDTGPRTDLSDTASVSIFELFGVPRPSETQTTNVASAESAAEPEVTETPQVADEPVTEAAAEPAETPEPADEPVSELATQAEIAPAEEAAPAEPVATAPESPAEPVRIQVETGPETATVSPTPIVITGEPGGRVGLRLRLRREQVHLRRPGPSR
ncbi:MAG: SRPBCC family protein [Phototrophicaceae bacterium]